HAGGGIAVGFVQALHEQSLELGADGVELVSAVETHDADRSIDGIGDERLSHEGPPGRGMYRHEDIPSSSGTGRPSERGAGRPTPDRCSRPSRGFRQAVQWTQDNRYAQSGTRVHLASGLPSHTGTSGNVGVGMKLRDLGEARA